MLKTVPREWRCSRRLQMYSREPYLTGSRCQGSIRGKRFELLVDGEEWSCTSWAGSEYTERLVTSYWHRGEGKIRYLSRKKPSACFLMGFGSRRPGMLVDAILTVSDWHLRDKPITSLLIPGKLEELIDFVCVRALESYRTQVGTCVPQVTVGNFSFKELVDNGFAFNTEGQAHLPLVA